MYVSRLLHHTLNCIPSFVCGILIIPPANEVGGVYRNHPVCLSVRLSVQSKLNLGYNF